MTIGIVVACKDGIVIGADRKVVTAKGKRIKTLEDKIFHAEFKDGRNFLICSSGGKDFARRAMDEINLNIFAEDIDCHSYRDILEGKVSYLAYSLRQKGIDYEHSLGFSTFFGDSL